MNIHRLTQVFTYITMIVLAIIGGFWLYWNFQPSDVLEIKNDPVSVRPSEINPEATIILHYDYCKKIQVKGIVQSSIISGTTKILLPDTTDTTEPTCKVFDVPIIVPGQTPDGVYHFEYIATYRVNPIRTTIERWRSQDFVIHHVPPLPANTTTVSPTTNITNSPATTTTTTNDGKGNTTTTTTNNAPKPTPTPKPLTEMITDSIGKVLKAVGL